MIKILQLSFLTIGLALEMLGFSWDVAFLKSAWKRAHKSCAIEPDWNEFNRIIAAYGDESRHYHCVKHLVYMLKFVNKNFISHKNDPVIVFATFYHDVVYVVTSKENEVKSANEWLAYASKNGFAKNDIELTASLILATINHKLPKETETFRIFLDADIGILAEPWSKYKKYATNIWREYRSVGTEIYIKNRLAFLEKAHTNMVFNTDYMTARIERMRENLREEMWYLRFSPADLLKD